MKNLVCSNFLFCASVVLALLVGLLGPGGYGAEKEDEKKPKAKPKQVADPFSNINKEDLRRGIGVSQVTVLVEVLEAGKIADDPARPAYFNDYDNSNMIPYYERQYGMALQRVQVKVIESFRGVKKGDILNVAVRHVNITAAMRVMSRGGIANRQKDPIRKEAKLKLNWKYLLVLSPDKTLKNLAGKTGPVYSTTTTVYSGQTVAAIKLAREFTKRIALFKKKSKPTETQINQARKFLEQLGANELQLRQAAKGSLVKMGLPILDIIEEYGQKTKDLEIRLQCRKIVYEQTPIPGGIPKDWAGDLVIK